MTTTSTLQKATAHWEAIQKVFEGFNDEELAIYLMAALETRSRDLRERVLMAITLLQAKVVETFRRQARQVASNAPANPYLQYMHPLPTNPIIPMKFLLISRESFTLQSSGQIVAHQFRVGTFHPHANPAETLHSVSIAGPQPACDCAEFIQKPGFCCQHILFVYVQVLKHPHAQQIYSQMGPTVRLPPPVTDPSMPVCCLCFQALPFVNENPSCSTCTCHSSCLETWRRLVARV